MRWNFSRPLATACSLALLSGCGALGGTAPPGYELGGLYATAYGPTGVEVAAAPGPRTPARRDRDREPSRPAASTAPAQPSPATAEQSTSHGPAECTRGTCGPATAEGESLAARYVEAVYRRNETRVAEQASPAVVDIYRFAQQAGVVYHATRPAIGDVVFFHNTWDRNGDGRPNDWYTHVGIVESVDESGTISFLAYEDGAVRRRWMNLEAPEVERRDGQTLNSVMRPRVRGEADDTQRLAGELFAGFANLLGDREEFYVMDIWQPDAEASSQASR